MTARPVVLGTPKAVTVVELRSRTAAAVRVAVAPEELYEAGIVVTVLFRDAVRVLVTVSKEEAALLKEAVTVLRVAVRVTNDVVGEVVMFR